jgi:hypothetical protein
MDENYISKLFIPGIDALGEVYCLVDIEYTNKYESYFIYPWGIFDTKFSLDKGSVGIKELAVAILSDIIQEGDEDIKYNSESFIRSIMNGFVDKYLTGNPIMEAEVLAWISITGGK